MDAEGKKTSGPKQSNAKKTIFRRTPSCLRVGLRIAVLLTMTAGAALALCPIDLSDSPLDTRLQAAPANIMFVLDDSGSMDWEFMTDEDQGVFWVDKVDHEYLFDDPGDNLYNTGVYSQTLDNEGRKKWKSQWSGYNRMYYNPDSEYTPWLDGSGNPTANADLQNPKSHPARAFTLNMGDIFTRVSGEDLYFSQQAKKTGEVKEGLCGCWVPIGTWDMPAGMEASVTIERSEESGGDNTSADAFRFTHASSGTVVIVDDADGAPSFATTGFWTPSGITPEWGSDSLYSWELGATAKFTPDLPLDGEYMVEGWWNCYQYRDDNAKVHVDDGRGVIVRNAHYYTYEDADGDGELDAGEGIYLVNFEDRDGDGNLDSRIFYKFVDSDGDEALKPDEVFEVADADVPASFKQRSGMEDLQNFTNWFQYYRKRWLATVAAVCRVLPKLENVRVGYRTINGNLIKRVLPVKVGGVDESHTLVDLLTNLYFDVGQASTPLRRGLEMVGLYYHSARTTGTVDPELENSPIELGAGGECQQNFAIVFTDGYWNGGAPLVSNEDGDNGAPYADKWSGMLADVAMYYYENDLEPSLEDRVPTNFLDKATHQHMVTYGITFGVQGHLNPDDYDLNALNPADRVYPKWPSPSFDNLDKIDDVWHAAVNGRGRYYNAQNPEELAAAFMSMINDLIARIGSGAPVSINGEELNEGTAIFQSGYNTENWTGDVLAYKVDANTGEVIMTPFLWSANEKLDNLDWDTERAIATYDGSAGIPFRSASLPADMKNMLDPDPDPLTNKANDMVGYLRGNHDLEVKNGGTFRDRYLIKDGATLRDTNKLGDIVHSGPAYHDNMVYVGANDGMLHALKADTGREIFAYIPHRVFSNLKLLTAPEYIHRYYVDQTPFVADTGSGTLLVGGLGGGGIGYFCLDVSDIPTRSQSDPPNIDETTLSSMVKWEYPRASTPLSDQQDLGYSFSRAFIVPSKAGWVVVFGNGYNSQNESAVLFVLDAFTGALLKKIDTGSGPCNGMSTPTPIDENNDGYLDHIYAGDLLGNVWKFDCQSGNALEWKVSYADSGAPAPLFQAKDEFGNPQPITNMCDAMYHCVLHGNMVVFGTGKYLGNSDFADNKTQTIYGVWDYGDDTDETEFLGTFERNAANQLSNQPATVSMLEQTELYFGQSGEHYLRVITDHEAEWGTDEDITDGENPNPSASTANHVGWYFDLPLSKERVVRDITIRDGKAIVVTVVPDTTSPCVAGGESLVHEIDACNGGRLEKPQFDANDDTHIDENDMVKIVDPVSGEEIIIPPSGIQYSSMLYEPVILSNPPVEIKYFGSASGRIETLRELPVRRGFASWRDIF